MSYLVLFFGVIIGFFIGIFLSPELRYEISKDWASWIAAISTLIIAMLTIVLSMETWRLRKLQKEQIDNIRKNSIYPLVNAKLEISEVDKICLNLLVENSGIGIAKNIKFKVSHIDSSQDNGSLRLSEIINKIGFIENGISSLGIKERRETFLFSFPDFTEDFRENFYEVEITINISYTDIDDNLYTNNSVFRMNEYKGISTIGGASPLYQIARNTDKISKTLNTIQSKFSK